MRDLAWELIWTPCLSARQIPRTAGESAEPWDDANLVEAEPLCNLPVI
jgi:hypothetical protein